MAGFGVPVLLFFFARHHLTALMIVRFRRAKRKVAKEKVYIALNFIIYGRVFIIPIKRH
jgi:hypothetical protein